ncbi:ALP1-like protein isoform X1 [Tanacetum coccineum]
MAYDTSPDAFDEYLQIAERTSRECLDHFTKCIHVLYYDKFLRRPTATDIKKTEEKHGLPGMLGSIDCMHWDWKNYPKSLHGQFKRSTNKYPTLMLEVVADQKLWIWHAYFGVPGTNNDLNVLYGLPLFDDEIADIASKCPFVVNGHTYMKCYYLADGIYPAWSTFVKTFSVARDEKTLKFKRVQEAVRKDIERAFGVLQGRWGIIRQPARAMQINILKRIMYCCIILHNMILEDEGFEVNFRDVFVNPAPNIIKDWVERCDLHVRKTKELRDRKTHIDFRQDLMEHLWNNDDEYISDAKLSFADVTPLFEFDTTTHSALMQLWRCLPIFIHGLVASWNIIGLFFFHSFVMEPLPSGRIALDTRMGSWFHGEVSELRELRSKAVCCRTDVAERVVRRRNVITQMERMPDHVPTSWWMRRLKANQMEDLELLGIVNMFVSRLYECVTKRENDVVDMGY